MTGFASSIRPLFRQDDVDAMRGWFDLSTYADVRANADGIYAQLNAGTMPCDGPWPPDQIQRFREWMDDGFPE